MAVYGGSKTTPKYLVEILAQEIGHRGVTVNSIIPGPVANTGVFVEMFFSFIPTHVFMREKNNFTHETILKKRV
jgi:short-subunit dehydrogenase